MRRTSPSSCAHMDTRWKSSPLRMPRRPTVHIRSGPFDDSTGPECGTTAAPRSCNAARGRPMSCTRRGCSGGARSARALRAQPYVVKLTADPAFERSRRRGLVEGDVDEFQRGGGGAASAFLRFVRDVELRHASHVFTPSAYLRELTVGWGVAPERVTVLPNPAPSLPAAAPARRAAARAGSERRHARIRRPLDGAEVAGACARGGRAVPTVSSS